MGSKEGGSKNVEKCVGTRFSEVQSFGQQRTLGTGSKGILERKGPGE